MVEKELQKSSAFQNFCFVLARLKTPADIAAFLRDVGTYKELKDMSDRLAVANLVQKEVPYRTIQKKTGVSTATITRVAQWLHHGCGGYLKALKILK
jgi:TrpR-related protein YerC/YecD